MYSFNQQKNNSRSITAVFSVIAILSLACASCSKCETCSKDSSDTIRVCEKDYDSNTGYGLKVDYYESMGYECKPSP